MKININNKEYDAVEAKEITHFPNATDAITLDGITYNLTEANPLQEELEREFEEWAKGNSTDVYVENRVATVDFAELSHYPALKEKVSSLIPSALDV